MPEAGWLSIGRHKEPLVFIPLKRYQKDTFPGMIPVMLGNGKQAKIAVHKSSSKQHSPQFVPVRIRKDAPDRLRVGPFIGILSMDGGSPFHGNHRNFADIIRTGRTMGVTVFVFTPRSLSASGQAVRGWSLDPRTDKIQWVPAVYPLPNVVYNRIPTRTDERRREVQETIRRLMAMPGVHFFNLGFFDKWSLTKLLLTSPELSPHLPDTMKLDSVKTLQAMLQKYPSLYLKPAEGKAGIGMMRLTARENGFELILQTARDKRKEFYPSLPALWAALQKELKKKEYIVQQAIPLAEYQGRPFDIRMLLQKDGNGQWDLTGMGIRVAGKGAISTHVPMGGRIENLQTVFRKTFPDTHRELLARAEETGLKLAAFIESKQHSFLGEMSIDLGVDQNGRLWFFEANAKPMKFDEPEIRTRSLRRLIEYSLFLSGFKQTVGGGKA
jgi:hypothetical protein